MHLSPLYLAVAHRCASKVDDWFGRVWVWVWVVGVEYLSALIVACILASRKT